MYLVMFHKNWKSFLRNIAVTSLAEVWIETMSKATVDAYGEVTSLAEVWIETNVIFRNNLNKWSLPLRKCGLKQKI